MSGRERAKHVTKEYGDSARQAVVGEWDRWASRYLSTGYMTTADDERRFFLHLQTDCPRLLPDRTDPWQTVHGWLLLERRVRNLRSFILRPMPSGSTAN